jgi:hypothetical protein
MLANDQAVNYDPNNPYIKKISDTILDYVEIVDPVEGDAVMRELQDIADEWEKLTTDTLVYRSVTNQKALLRRDTEDSRFRTMNSMRNVDLQAGIYLL